MFNALPRQSKLRLTVYKTLLQLASDQEELEILGLDRAEVEKWVHEWDVPSEDKSNFLQLVAAAFAKCGQSCVCHNPLLFIGSDADSRTNTNQGDRVRIYTVLCPFPPSQL